MLITNQFYLVALGFMTIGLSYLGVSIYSKWAINHQILDIPNERSSHTRPVPRGAGLVIVAFTLVGLCLFQISGCCTSWAVFLCFATGSLLISGVSWLDDLNSLPVRPSSFRLS